MCTSMLHLTYPKKSPRLESLIIISWLSTPCGCQVCDQDDAEWPYWDQASWRMFNFTLWSGIKALLSNLIAPVTLPQCFIPPTAHYFTYININRKLIASSLVHEAYITCTPIDHIEIYTWNKAVWVMWCINYLVIVIMFLPSDCMCSLFIV